MGEDDDLAELSGGPIIIEIYAQGDERQNSIVALLALIGLQYLAGRLVKDYFLTPTTSEGIGPPNRGWQLCLPAATHLARCEAKPINDRCASSEGVDR